MKNKKLVGDIMEIVNFIKRLTAVLNIFRASNGGTSYF